MATIQALGWCDQNMQKVYPLDDDANGISVSGEALPESFLVDIQLIVPRIKDPQAASKFYISEIRRNMDSFVVRISYQSAVGKSTLCAESEEIPTTLVNTDSMEDRTFSINATGGNDDIPELNGIQGSLIVGTCLDMANKGTLSFRYNATRIISVRVYMYTQGLDSVTFISGANAITLRDNFTIEAGDGIDIRWDSVTNAIILTRGLTAEEKRSPYKSVNDILRDIYQLLGGPIRMINGISPDTDGNFIIDGADCVDVTDTRSGIIISNPCSQPCCNDTSTQDIANALNFLKEAEARLETYYKALTVNLDTMQSRLASLIASRK